MNSSRKFFFFFFFDTLNSVEKLVNFNHFNLKKTFSPPNDDDEKDFYEQNIKTSWPTQITTTAVTTRTT